MSETNKESQQRICVVDDSKAICGFISSALREFGYTVDVFTDPALGLQKCIDSPPHCVLCDYEMPGINGLEFIQKFKANHREVPVVILSSQDQDQTIVNCINAGAEDYLLKRTNPEVLVAKVQLLVELNHARKLQIDIERFRTFSATVATLNHEFNNLYTIISPILQLAKNADPQSIQRLQEKSESLIDNFSRVVKVVQSLSNLSEVEFEAYTSDYEMLKLKK